jgi:hypothetical protein
MRILGISALYHDSAAATVVVDGRRKNMMRAFPAEPSPTVSPTCLADLSRRRRLRPSELDSVGARKNDNGRHDAAIVLSGVERKTARNFLSTKMQKHFSL